MDNCEVLEKIDVIDDAFLFSNHFYECFSLPGMKECLLDKLYRQLSGNPDDWKLIIILAFKLNCFDDALELCRRLLQSDVCKVQATRFLARTLENMTFFNEAEYFFHLGLESGDIVIYEYYLQFLLKHPQSSSEILLREHCKYAQLFCRKFPGIDVIESRRCDGARKVNVGFTCSFFNSSTIIHQFYCWLVHLSTNLFNIFLYVGDEVVPEYLINSSFHVRHTNVSSLDDASFLQLTRNDGLDILVELNGFSPGHRFLAMYNRCAPVQVSYLNHTATCGIDEVDFLLADEVSLPEDDEQFFLEKICRIPGCFFCFNFDDENDFPVSYTPPFIENGFITYGYFGGSAKLNDFILEMMAEILKTTPCSRLMVANLGMSARRTREKIYEFFNHFGVDRSRLTLHNGTDRYSIAKYHKDVDVCLDTWPYCGGNTIAESLWYGVPVVTLYGDRFSSRYGASLLKACELENLVAYSRIEYISLASQLASEEKLLIDLRKSLRKNMKKKGGFSDVEAFAGKMKNCLLSMLANNAVQN